MSGVNRICSARTALPASITFFQLKRDMTRQLLSSEVWQSSKDGKSVRSCGALLGVHLTTTQICARRCRLTVRIASLIISVVNCQYMLATKRQLTPK